MEITIQISEKLTEDCMHIRQEVFVSEQGFVDEFDEIDGHAYHVVAYDGSEPVATGRVFADSEAKYHIGRVAVLRTYRGTGIGRLVMSALEQKAKELGAKQVSLSAQCQAAGFYKSIGYTETDDLHLDQGCPHVTMIRTF